jgi:pyridoxal phosphate enzyme (YggS family)
MSNGTVVAERLASIRDRIGAAGGDPEAVTVVAVTKGFGPEAVEAGLDAGLHEIGENYAQELLAKAEAVTPRSFGPHWHFLGAPQRNKIGRLAPIVSLWEGMDREAAIDRLAAVRPGAAVLLQVNVVADPAKAGCDVDDVGRLVDHGRSAGLDVRGLMTVGPAGDIDGSRKVFATLARMAADHELGEISMGMSDDFEAAVAEGSTMIRLGRALFGPRPVAGRARR